MQLWQRISFKLVICWNTVFTLVDWTVLRGLWGPPLQTFWWLQTKLKCWSIFCCLNSLPFNVWSANMISVFKSHLKIHFYRLLSIVVRNLCCLTTELNDATLLNFVVYYNIAVLLFHAALFFHTKYFGDSVAVLFLTCYCFFMTLYVQSLYYFLPPGKVLHQ